jgi:hypothetical protein
MIERRHDQLTLRELFIEAERLNRELIEHLEQGFLPKVQGLTRLAAPGYVDVHGHPAGDITVRNAAAQVLESEAYTEQLNGRIQDYCEAIDREVTRIIAEP